MTPDLSLIDSHCHLDFDRFQDDFDDVLLRAAEVGVEHMVTIGASRGFDSNLAALALAKKHDQISCTVGIHPHDARVADDAVFARLDELATEPEVVAIGETGLDYHYDHSPRDVQQAVFRRFVEMARAHELPVVIHSREAEEDTIAILREENATACGGVLHCFSGTRAFAEAGLALGFYVSFSGIVTFKKAEEIREVAGMVPLDRLLVETDAPYLAPVPRRGRRNEPSYVRHTLEAIAALRGMDAVELAAITTDNARRFYSLER